MCWCSNIDASLFFTAGETEAPSLKKKREARKNRDSGEWDDEDSRTSGSSSAGPPPPPPAAPAAPPSAEASVRHFARW